MIKSLISKDVLKAECGKAYKADVKIRRRFECEFTRTPGQDAAPRLCFQLG
jgi:hypothetical protein